MKLLTIRTPNGTRAVRQVDDVLIEVDGFNDVGMLLRNPVPGKIVCVGLNYRTHILEIGRELPEYPTLFSKFADALTDPYDEIELPSEDPAVDWEAELAVVVGRAARRVSREHAESYIGGYTICNDVSMRTWQFRTKEWLQGKNWEKSTPLGPTTRSAVEASCIVSPSTRVRIVPPGDHHDPAFLVSYISTMITLNPGDVIITGTPGGVGHARRPRRYLSNGQLLQTSIEGPGELTNRIVKAQKG